MSPYQHGEVFVTDDGAETDLDLGHYERFTDESLTAGCSVSAGRSIGAFCAASARADIWAAPCRSSRISRTRSSPASTRWTTEHPTYSSPRSAARSAISSHSRSSRPSGRWLPSREEKNVLFIHVPMIVEIPGSGELKSKPTQHSVKELLSIGIQPDILVCRTNQPMTEEICRKIALFCNMEPDCVIPNTTASTLYEGAAAARTRGPCKRRLPQAGACLRRART